MTRQEVLDIVSKFTPQEEQQWMFDLGARLTIAARGAYAVDHTDGDILRLMGFNEMQHQIYGRARELRSGGAWTMDSFLDGLIEKATFYKTEGDLGWAVRTSLERILNQRRKDQNA